MKLHLCLFLILFQSTFSISQPIKVADNNRFLQTRNGKPFFWLGDTAWELFHRLDWEEAERYLQNR